MSEAISIELDRKEIGRKVQEGIDKVIETEMQNNETAIMKSIQKLFKIELLEKDSDLDDQLKWTVEYAVKRGFDKAVEEIGLEDKIAEKTKELLNDEEVIMKFAMKRIEQGFGIN